MTEDQVRALLRLPASDTNYAGGLTRLSDEQLHYCLEHETRVSGLELIQREVRRRNNEAKAEADRTVWTATGYTYHLFKDCGAIRRATDLHPLKRESAERMGHRLCKQCSRQERGSRVRAARP